MSDAAATSMTVDEFLEWQRTQEELYELVDGAPVLYRAAELLPCARQPFCKGSVPEVCSRQHEAPDFGETTYNEFNDITRLLQSYGTERLILALFANDVGEPASLIFPLFRSGSEDVG